MIKDTNFITIQGWMINRLELKGLELLTYALIFGFSQEGESRFRGSLQFISEMIGATKRRTVDIVQSLIDRGYIVKYENVVNGIRLCEYAVVENFIGGEKISPVGEKISESGEKISPINNNINIYNNKYSAKTKGEREQAFAEKCKPYRAKYGDAMIDKFIYYWTEGENKMRFEKQDVFEVGRRLATWAQRDAERTPQPQAQTEPKKHMSVDEIMKKHYGIE